MSQIVSKLQDEERELQKQYNFQTRTWMNTKGEPANEEETKQLKERARLLRWEMRKENQKLMLLNQTTPEPQKQILRALISRREHKPEVVIADILQYKQSPTYQGDGQRFSFDLEHDASQGTPVPQHTTGDPQCKVCSVVADEEISESTFTNKFLKPCPNWIQLLRNLRFDGYINAMGSKARCYAGLLHCEIAVVDTPECGCIPSQLLRELSRNRVAQQFVLKLRERNETVTDVEGMRRFHTERLQSDDVAGCAVVYEKQVRIVHKCDTCDYTRTEWKPFQTNETPLPENILVNSGE